MCRGVSPDDLLASDAQSNVEVVSTREQEEDEGVIAEDEITRCVDGIAPRGAVPPPDKKPLFHVALTFHVAVWFK